MATKTLKQIKEETGRNLDDLTEDNDNVFVETAAGSAGVSTIFKMLSRRIHNVLSGLTALASGTDTDYAVIVRNGTAKKITLNNLADYVMASGQDASVDSLTVTGSASFGGTIGGSGITSLLADYYNKQSVDDKINFSRKETVTLVGGTTKTVDLDTNACYLLVASGNNYGQFCGIVTNGYNQETRINAFISHNIVIEVSAFKKLSIQNRSSGAIPLYVYRIF